MKKRQFRYPSGTLTPQMMDYARKPLHRETNVFHHHFKPNKFNASKVVENGHKFDSKTELRYYNLLKLKHVKFKVHPRYPVIDHTEFRFNGRTCKVRKHSYTPDFVLYKGKRIVEVDDIKGISQVPAYDHLRMDLFSLRYHIPVTIVRYKRKHFVKKTRNLGRRRKS